MKRFLGWLDRRWYLFLAGGCIGAELLVFLIFRENSYFTVQDNLDLFVAHFQRGEDIGNIAVLADIAAECGDRKDDVTAYLESKEGEPQVKSLVKKVGGLGVSGVPHFILQRRLAVSGAQSATVLAAAIMQAMQLPG